MRITHSDECTEILTLLAEKKQLKYARPLAMFSTASNTAIAETMVKVVCGKYPGAPDLVRGVAKQSNTSFFFDKPEAVVLQELRALKLPQKGKTAPVVIIKMIYTRLAKLFVAIELMKKLRAENDDLRDRWSAPPELTRDKINPQLGRTPEFDHKTIQWGVIEKARDLGALLERDDMTEELIDEAWKLFTAHRIMET
jgi:hypothetical protein